MTQRRSSPARSRLVRVVVASALALTAVVPVAAGAAMSAVDARRLTSPTSDVIGHSDCSQEVPRSQSLAAIVPSPANVALDAVVVTEVKDLPVARRIFAAAARAYSPLGITLKVRFRLVQTVPELKGDPRAYIAWLKKQTGGVRPPGTDVVYLATHHSVDGAGIADCIGGVAHPEHAFAMGQLTFDGIIGADIDGSPVPIPSAPLEDGGAKLAAHEIGHLLGAHHHYGAQCGLAIDRDDPEHPCDVMFTLPRQQLGLRFGPLNAAVVRDQAVTFARP